MIDDGLAAAAIAVGTVACAALAPNVPPARSTCSVAEERMTSDEITIEETTQAQLSGHYVGVSNIWERELPDDKGVVVPRMSASLTIFDLASEQSRDEKVFAGSVISLGADRYCVVKVEEGKAEPGKITLRKLPP